MDKELEKIIGASLFQRCRELMGGASFTAIDFKSGQDTPQAAAASECNFCMSVQHILIRSMSEGNSSLRHV